MNGPGDDSVSASNRRTLLTNIWRRKLAILGTMLMVTGISVLWVTPLTLRYVAVAKIVIEPPMTVVAGVPDTAGNPIMDYYSMRTQAEILRSHALAERAVAALTSMEQHRVSYRGIDAAVLAETRSFESVAEWLWGRDFPSGTTSPQWRASSAALAAGRAVQQALPYASRPMDRIRAARTTFPPKTVARA